MITMLVFPILQNVFNNLSLTLHTAHLMCRQIVHTRSYLFFPIHCPAQSQDQTPRLLTVRSYNHAQIPNGFEALPFPAVLTACCGFFPDMFGALPCPERPKGLPPVETRGPLTPTASLMLLPYPATPWPQPRVVLVILRSEMSSAL